MPSVFQLSATVTPSAAIGTATLSTRWPCSGSSKTNIVDITVPLPDWLANRLWPDTR